ncbi:MAG: hypothetical protein JW706_06775 [Opitutales bacterium]|nr:hypothetical protein [Opitutales bacterium]
MSCKRDEIVTYTIPKEERLVLVEGSRDGLMQASAGPVQLKWTVPQSWVPEADRPMREATWTIRGKSAPVEVILSRWSGGAGRPLENVNRWRGQIGLNPVDGAFLLEARMLVESKAGQVQVWVLPDPALEVDAASDTTMIAAMLDLPDASWFVRMTGETAAVLPLRAEFMTFVSSLEPAGSTVGLEMEQ